MARKKNNARTGDKEERARVKVHRDVRIRYINHPEGASPSWEHRLGPLRISPSYMDSFEVQTDRMSATDAHTELLTRVRTIREEMHDYSEQITLEEADGTVRKVRVMREELFHAACSVLWEIEDMLEPKGPSFWRLPELRQRRRGKRTVPLAIANAIYHYYGGTRCFEPETPSKAVMGELAEKWGL